MKKFLLGVVVGLAFGLVAGALRWRVKAVQTQEWKTFQAETARVRDTCLDSLMWERTQHTGKEARKQ